MSTPAPTGRGPRLDSTAAKVVLAAAVGLGVLFAAFAIVSPDPATAIGEFLTGAVSNPGRITQWLSYSSELMVTGAAVCLVFRVGLFTIGVEGQVFIGALLAGLVALGLGSGPLTLLLATAASALGGFLWGLIPGLMKAYLGADELVTSLLLNYVATFLFSFVLKQFLTPANAGFPVSAYFAPSVGFPTLGTDPAVPVTLLLGVVVCLAVSTVLTRSRFGYRLRVVGDSPRFAHANGLPVRRLMWIAIALSGAIAGLAGAGLAFGTTHRLIVGMATGIGFDGLTVALLAFSRPILVPIAALAYGYLTTGGDVIQITANVPSQVVVVLQGVLILLIATVLRGRTARARRTTPPTGEEADDEPGPLDAAERSEIATATTTDSAPAHRERKAHVPGHDA